MLWRLLVGRRKRIAASYLHTSTSTASFQVSEDSPILVRDFIHQALYNPQHGYFSAKPDAVGIMSEPISFNTIKGRRHYMELLADLYKNSDVSWFTPVELFKPWYGYALSRYILENHDRRFPLQIFEIGGGTGTCAKNVLDYVKLEDPGVYDNMKYISVEISDALARIQLSYVHRDDTHKSHFSVECRDASQKRGWGKVDGYPCFVIMLEVLDNQPHDLIYKENPASMWMETRLSKASTNGKLMEVYQPVKDPLVQRCIDILEYGSNPESPWMVTLKNVLSNIIPLKKKIWIPTATLQLLETLYTCRPNMSLIISDFDSLPDVKVGGICAPLVSRKKEGITEDLNSYLDAKGDADIFFPTDFDFLRNMDIQCSSILGKNGADAKKGIHRNILSTSSFMKRYADISRTQTRSSFNPLLDDYSNMKFYLSQRRRHQ